MSSFFITYDNGPMFYSYNVNNKKIDYTKLSNFEINKLLKYVLSDNILKVQKLGDGIEVIYGTTRIVIDDIRVFNRSHDRYSFYIEELAQKISVFRENEEIKRYKNNLPKGYRAKLNRQKCKSMSKRLMLSGMSFVVALGVSSAFKKEINVKEQDVLKNIEYEMNNQELVETTLNKDYFVNQEYIVPEVENSNYIELAFNENMSKQKYDETIAYCGDIIKYYADRYGLPYEILCAQITQERPDIINGVCENICQIESEYFIGTNMHVPVYDKFGFTNTYDDFTITSDMLNTLEGNIMVSASYTRECVDKHKSFVTGLFSYNQGINALRNACDFYGENVNDYLGDKNSIKARDIINKYYREGLNKKHGDPNYLENVFRYLPIETRGNANISYYLDNKFITVDLINSNVYNSGLSR